MIKEKKKPAYLTIYQDLRNSIINKMYSYGQKLPSKRTLADETASSVITVEHAYSLLEEEGFIEARERSGYYVIYNESENINSDFDYKRDKLSKGESVQSLTTADPIPNTASSLSDSDLSKLFPYSSYAKTVRRVLADYEDLLLSKSPNNGLALLREAISTYLGRVRGIDVSSQQIIISSGAEALYGLIAQYLGKDQTMALEAPSYEQIRKVYKSHGLKLEYLSMGKDGIKSQALNSSIACALHVTPVNSYPSGITAPASKRYEYIAWAHKRGSLIIEDDFDSEFSSPTRVLNTLFSLDPNNSVFYINTFSRTIAPSTRVGYMIIPKNLCQDFNQRLGFYSCSVPVFDQLIIAEFIRNGDFERHINKVRRHIKAAES